MTKPTKLDPDLFTPFGLGWELGMHPDNIYFFQYADHPLKPLYESLEAKTLPALLRKIEAEARRIKNERN